MPIQYDRGGRVVIPAEFKQVPALEDDPRIILPQRNTIQGAGQRTPQLPQVTTYEVTPTALLADYTRVGSRGWMARTSVIAAAQVFHFQINARSSGGIIIERLQLASSGAGPFGTVAFGISPGRIFLEGSLAGAMQIGQYPSNPNPNAFTPSVLSASTAPFLGFGVITGADVRPFANGQAVEIFVPPTFWFGIEADAASAGTDVVWEIIFRELEASATPS